MDDARALILTVNDAPGVPSQRLVTAQIFVEEERKKAGLGEEEIIPVASPVSLQNYARKKQ